MKEHDHINLTPDIELSWNSSIHTNNKVQLVCTGKIDLKLLPFNVKNLELTQAWDYIMLTFKFIRGRRIMGITLLGITSPSMSFNLDSYIKGHIVKSSNVYRWSAYTRVNIETTDDELYLILDQVDTNPSRRYRVKLLTTIEYAVLQQSYQKFNKEFHGIE